MQAVAALSPLLQVNAGGRHTLALGADNRLWAFGDNSEGQLGRDSQQECSSHPVLVQGLPDSAVVQFVVAGGLLTEQRDPLPIDSSVLEVKEHSCVHWGQAEPDTPVHAAVMLEHAQRSRPIKGDLICCVQCTKPELAWGSHVKCSKPLCKVAPLQWHGGVRLMFGMSLRAGVFLISRVYIDVVVMCPALSECSHCCILGPSCSLCISVH